VSVLVFFHLLAASIWVGGFVAIVVVARVARRELEPPARIAFFRGLGRAYGIVGGSALAVALATGAALLADHGWDATATVAAALAGVLVLATVAGVRQARGMTRIRRAAAAAPDDPALAFGVSRGARRAAVLRGAIGALTLALLAIGAAIAA
jgi:uncharacterized membrane protein